MRSWVVAAAVGFVVVVGLAWWAFQPAEVESESAASANRVASGSTPAAASPSPDQAEAAPQPKPVVPEAKDEIPRELKKLLKGDPAPGEWTEEVDELYTEAVFTEQVEELLEECESEHRIIDVACDEAPCMVAWSAPPDAEYPSSCPQWIVAFDTGSITRVAFDVDCPDGRRVRAELATPHGALMASVDRPHSWNGGRMAHRAAAYTVSDWCE